MYLRFEHAVVLKTSIINNDASDPEAMVQEINRKYFLNYKSLLKFLEKEYHLSDGELEILGDGDTICVGKGHSTYQLLVEEFYIEGDV